MNSHELASKLLALPNIEVKCLGNTEEFDIKEVDTWNGEFVYLSKHRVDKTEYV